MKYIIVILICYVKVVCAECDETFGAVNYLVAKSYKHSNLNEIFNVEIYEENNRILFKAKNSVLNKVSEDIIEQVINNGDLYALNMIFERPREYLKGISFYKHLLIASKNTPCVFKKNIETSYNLMRMIPLGSIKDNTKLYVFNNDLGIVFTKAMKEYEEAILIFPYNKDNNIQVIYLKSKSRDRITFLLNRLNQRDRTLSDLHKI